MMTKICLLVLACVVAVNAADPAISLVESNVDVDYDEAAVKALEEAYYLYPAPADEAIRLHRFSELFGESNTNRDGWNVAYGCTLVYLPNNPKSITLKVVEYGANEAQAKYIRIFGNKSS